MRSLNRTPYGIAPGVILSMIVRITTYHRKEILLHRARTQPCLTNPYRIVSEVTDRSTIYRGGGRYLRWGGGGGGPMMVRVKHARARGVWTLEEVYGVSFVSKLRFF